MWTLIRLVRLTCSLSFYFVIFFPVTSFLKHLSASFKNRFNQKSFILYINTVTGQIDLDKQRPLLRSQSRKSLPFDLEMPIINNTYPYAHISYS